MFFKLSVGRAIRSCAFIDFSIPRLKYLCRTIRHQHGQRNHQQYHPDRPRNRRCQHLAPVFDVEFGPGGEFILVGGFDSLFSVPPGAVAVEVGTDVRRPDYRHNAEYSTNFLIFCAEMSGKWTWSFP